MTYNVTSGAWNAVVNINFTTSYNPTTNQTTFTFGDCTYSYSGKKGYGTSIYTEIWVSADWDPNTAVAATLSISSTTNGSTKTFTGTPSPSTLTVQHASTAGNKIGVYSSTTKIGVYPWSNSTGMYYYNGSGEGTVTSTTLYTFHKNVSSGVSVSTITNTSNEYRELEEGSLIHAGSVLQMWRAAADGYTLTEAHFGGGGVLENGATHTVTGDTTVTITADVNSYSLTINPSIGSSIIVNRTSSPLKGAVIGNITSSDPIYYNDSLTITFVALSGYKLVTTTVNGSDFTSGKNHIVTGNVEIVSISAIDVPMYQVYIDNGTSWDLIYLIYKDNGSNWSLVYPCVDLVSNWSRIN